MPTNSIIYLLIFLNTLSLLLVVILLFLIEYAKKHEPTSPTVASMLSEARSRANTIIHTATIQARKIIADAEIKGARLIAHERLESKKLRANYQEQIENLIDEIKKHLQQTTEKTEQTYSKYIKALETSLNDAINKDKKMLAENSQVLFDRTKTVIDTLMAEVHDKVIAYVEENLKQTSQAISEYRTKQMMVVDNQIAEIVEETVRKTLGKTLSLEEQIDLLYQSLEEAKKEKFFA